MKFFNKINNLVKINLSKNMNEIKKMKKRFETFTTTTTTTSVNESEIDDKIQNLTTEIVDLGKKSLNRNFNVYPLISYLSIFIISICYYFVYKPRFVYQDNTSTETENVKKDISTKRKIVYIILSTLFWGTIFWIIMCKISDSYLEKELEEKIVELNELNDKFTKQTIDLLATGLENYYKGFTQSSTSSSNFN